jgi:hypothetical protein
MYKYFSGKSANRRPKISGVKMWINLIKQCQFKGEKNINLS